VRLVSRLIHRCLALCVLLAFVPSTFAFDVDSFKSGMTREQVKEAAKSYNFDHVQDFSATTLIAYDDAEKGSNRQFVFEFCNDKLVGLQQDMAPSMRNLMIMVNNYNSKYGQPSKVAANTNVTSIGERNEMTFFWRKGLDVLGVRYVLTAPVEQLTLQYETPNNCWQVPR
jgi:hypothetical protein